MRNQKGKSRQFVRRHERGGRRGVMVIAALTCLLIVTALIGNMLRGAIAARRHLHAERDRRQAELLLQAAADRAARRLASDPQYRGDTWDLPAEAIVGHGAGRVSTELSRSTGDSIWQAHIVAEYPLGRDFPIRRSQTFQFSDEFTQSEE
jgi:hypothetical protein